MGRDSASERVPIALAEGRPEDSRLRAPRSSPRYGQQTAATGSAGVTVSGRPRKPPTGLPEALARRLKRAQGSSGMTQRSQRRALSTLR